jgi:hypothetical protein
MDLIRFRKELAMYDRFSTYFLESYARDHYADLLAETEKARLIKEALVHRTPHQTSRTMDVQFRIKSALTVLATFISQILS